MAAAAMHYLEVEGGRMAWRESGSGERTIVWVHGLPLDSRSWARQEEHFRDRARNIVCDLRGYGASDKLPDGVQDISQLYADDLHVLITSLAPQDAILVGFASAGHIGLRYAAQHPATLSQLVAINASPRFRRGDDWPYGFDDAGIAHFLDAAHQGIEALTDAILDPSLVFCDVDTPTATRLRSWFWPMSVTAGTATLLGFFEGISRDDDRALLAQIATPTLLIASTIGQEVPSDVGLYLREHIGQSALVELPGVDHFAFATRPDMINLLVEQVL